MYTVCPHDKVTYEQASDIPDYGVCHFITLLSFRPGNVVVRRESHVFISHPERHLHEITYMNSSGLDPATLESECVRATHQLFASYRADNPSSLDSGFAAKSRFESPLTYRVTPHRDAPFGVRCGLGQHVNVDIARMHAGLFAVALGKLVRLHRARLLIHQVIDQLHKLCSVCISIEYLVSVTRWAHVRVFIIHVMYQFL